MGRPRKVPLEPIPAHILADVPVKATESPVEAFLVKDPTSSGGKRILRVHGSEELQRFINRGWIRA